jgi:hypothetical protein
MQRAIGRSRVLLVLLMAFGLLLGSAAAPAAATGGGEGDDTESVRAQTIGTIDLIDLHDLRVDLKRPSPKPMGSRIGSRPQRSRAISTPSSGP